MKSCVINKQMKRSEELRLRLMAALVREDNQQGCEIKFNIADLIDSNRLGDAVNLTKTHNVSLPFEVLLFLGI